jgi:hypothetical protein
MTLTPDMATSTWDDRAGDDVDTNAEAARRETQTEAHLRN